MSIRTKSEIKLRARVAVYAKEFTARLYAGKIPAPSGGDCWACCMVDEHGHGALGGASHILSHVSARERYYVPSLVIRALRRFGSRAGLHNAAILMGMAPAGTQLWFNGDPDKFLQRQTQSAIRRFCLCELGLIYKGRKFYHEMGAQ